LALPARSPRPLLSARDKAVGGSVLDSAQFSANPDMTFIPGYSDKRRLIDYELGRGLEPTVELNHRFQWVRVADSNGRAVKTKPIQFKGMRCQRVTQDMLEGLGIQMPLAGEVAADGGIRLGDTELYVCSAEVAGENEAIQHRALSSQTADDATASQLHSAGREFDRSGNNTTAETTHRVEVTPR